MESNKQLNTLRILLERNKHYKVKSGYDGSKILTQWDKFGEYKSQNKRRKYIINISWNLISLGKPIEHREELIKQYKDSNEYLYKNRDKIIDYWMNKHDGSDFLLTLIVMFLFFTNQLSILDEYNIEYQNIFEAGKIKKNMKAKYSEIENFLSMSKIKTSSNNIEMKKNKSSPRFSANIQDLLVAKRQGQSNSQQRNPKVDEKISNSSKENGDIAEQQTFEHMQKAIEKYESYFYRLIGMEVMDNIKIEDTFRINSNAGYDILIKREGKPYASFEVKSIISTQKGSFFISANELKHLQSNDLHRFLVLYKNDDDIRILNAKEVMKYMEKVPVSYKVTIRN